MATTSDDEIAAAIIGELKPYAVKVLIEDYKPEWRTSYAAAKAMICGVLGPLVLRIEHTGSTAVAPPSPPSAPSRSGRQVGDRHAAGRSGHHR